MHKIVIFTLLTLTYSPYFYSAQQPTTQNMVTIHGVLTRQLSNGTHIVSADQKYPGYWVLTRAKVDDQTNRTTYPAVIVYGLRRRVQQQEGMLYPEACFMKIEKVANDCYQNGQQFANKHEAFQQIQDLYKHQQTHQRLFSFVNDNTLSRIKRFLPFIDDDTLSVMSMYPQ